MVKSLYDYGLSLENLYGRNTIGNTAIESSWALKSTGIASRTKRTKALDMSTRLLLHEEDGRLICQVLQENRRYFFPSNRIVCINQQCKQCCIPINYLLLTLFKQMWCPTVARIYTIFRFLASCSVDGIPRYFIGLYCTSRACWLHFLHLFFV